MIARHSCRSSSKSSNTDEDQEAKHLLFWICLTNLKLFDPLLELGNQTLLILHFRLKLDQLKIFSLGSCDKRKREK